MSATSQVSDAEFLRAFEQATIPKAEWTHEAHVRMAWAYLMRLPADEALTAVRDGIKRYNAAVGGPANGYHETITRVYFELIRDRIATSPKADWLAFRAENPLLVDRANPVTRLHYKKETLMSDAARASFVPPDLAPLPNCATIR